MQRVFDYFIFLSLLFLALIALEKVFNGNLWVLGILCVAVIRFGFVNAPKIDQYRNSRRIRRGIAEYLNERADAGRKDNRSGLCHWPRKTIDRSVG